MPKKAPSVRTKHRKMHPYTTTSRHIAQKYFDSFKRKQNSFLRHCKPGWIEGWLLGSDTAKDRLIPLVPLLQRLCIHRLIPWVPLRCPCISSPILQVPHWYPCITLCRLGAHQQFGHLVIHQLYQLAPRQIYGNVYYHLNLSCITTKQPPFNPTRLAASQEVVKGARQTHSDHFKTMLEVSLAIPTRTNN